MSKRRIFRFAPSPNGRLHLGHAYSALLNQKLAQDHTQALSKLQSDTQAELTEVQTQFEDAENTIRAYGGQKQGEASAMGDMALPYSGDQLDAARKAAHQVAEKYAAAMPENANEAAEQIGVHLPPFAHKISGLVALDEKRDFAERFLGEFESRARAADPGEAAALARWIDGRLKSYGKDPRLLTGEAFAAWRAGETERASPERRQVLDRMQAAWTSAALPSDGAAARA